MKIRYTKTIIIKYNSVKNHGWKLIFLKNPVMNSPMNQNIKTTCAFCRWSCLQIESNGRDGFWVGIQNRGSMLYCVVAATLEKDLSGFDKGQIVVARQLCKSITGTVRLISFSRGAVVSTYQRWLKKDETPSRRQGITLPRSINGRGEWRLRRIVLLDRRATWLKLPMNLIVLMHECVITHCSWYIVVHEIMKSSPHSCTLLITIQHLWARSHAHWTT